MVDWIRYFPSGDLVWSKLETGRLPSMGEIKGLLQEPSQYMEPVSTPSTETYNV